LACVNVVEFQVCSSPMYRDAQRENEMLDEVTRDVLMGDTPRGQVTLDSTHDHSMLNPEQWPHGLAARMLEQAMYENFVQNYINALVDEFPFLRLIIVL
jgi:hypothetical protein